MKRIEKIIIILVACCLAGFLGCSAVMDAVTPAYIEPKAIHYADVNVPAFTPYTSLWDARRVNTFADHKHKEHQIILARLAEDDTTTYAFLKNSLSISIKNAEAFQEAVFSPEGPFGLLMPTVFGTALGAYLISKPSDKRKIEELEKKLNGNHTNSTTNA